LVRQGVLQCREPIPGRQSTGYCLTDRYLADHHVRCFPVVPQVLERFARLEAYYAKEQAKRRLPIHDALNALQYEYLTVDQGQAEAILDVMPIKSFICQDVLVSNLVRRELTNSVGRTGRYFNGLTGVSRHLRVALRIAGEHLANVDVTCAQPGLLALLMQLSLTPPCGLKGVSPYKHSWLDGMPSQVCALRCAGLPAAGPDVASFRSDVCQQDLYALLAEATGLERSVVKRRFLVDVLAPRLAYPSPVRSAFRLLFPSVAEFIEYVNRDDHAELIRLLQRLEAWLVVETVAPKLVNVCPIVTLHDAIFCRASDLPAVRHAFEETFQEIDFTLRLKNECPDLMPALLA
jgi:hypothetical protein